MSAWKKFWYLPLIFVLFGLIPGGNEVPRSILLVYKPPCNVGGDGAINEMEEAIRDRIFLAGLDWVKVKRISQKIYLRISESKRGDIPLVRSLVERSGDISIGILAKPSEVFEGGSAKRIEEAVKYWKGNLLPPGKRVDYSVLEVKKIKWGKKSSERPFEWVVGDPGILSDGSFKGCPKIEIRKNEWKEDLPLFLVRRIFFPLNPFIEKCEPYAFAWGGDRGKLSMRYGIRVYLSKNALKKLTSCLMGHPMQPLVWVLDGVLVSGGPFLSIEALPEMGYLTFDLVQVKRRPEKREILFFLYSILSKRLSFIPEFVGIIPEKGF